MNHWSLYTQVWKILIQYYKKPKRTMVLLALLIIAASALGILLPYLIKQLVDQSPLRQFDFNIQRIWTLDSLYLLALAYSLGWLLSNILMHLSNWLSGFFLKNIDCALVYEGLDNFFHLKFQQQSSIDTGVLNSDIWRGASAFGQLTYTCLFILLPILFEIFAMMWVLSQSISFNYALFFVLFAFLTFGITLWLSFKSKDIFTDMFEAHNQVNGFFVEKVQNFYDVQLNASKNYQLDLFAQNIENYRRASFRSYKRMSYLMMLQVMMVGVFLTSFMLVTVYLFELKQVTAGDVVLISSYVIALAMPVLQVSQSLIRLKGDLIAVKKYHTYFQLEKNEISQVSIQPSNIIYKFEHAEIKLGAQQIQDFNLCIEQGRCYVIIGQTGIGKSTFIHYLLGMRQIDAGNLYYKNINITQQFSKQIFNQVAVVSQFPVIYSGTLRQNLIHNSEYHYSDEQLTQYLEHFYLSQILDQHGYGLDDDLQLIYKTFSGGEKQRLSIIRALLKQPQCLIMDEPTAALNEQIGYELLHFIRSRVDTIIMISHAAYAKQFADQLIDFDQLIT